MRASSSTWRCSQTSTTADSGTSGTQPSSHGLSWCVYTSAYKALSFIDINSSVLILYLSFCQGILNPMQAFLNTLAFHGWTGCDVDLSLQRRRELAWDSMSTSVPNAAGHNPIVGSAVLYQSHVQESQKNKIGNGQHHSDAISVLSEGNWPVSGDPGSPVYQGWWCLQTSSRFKI